MKIDPTPSLLRSVGACTVREAAALAPESGAPAKEEPQGFWMRFLSVLRDLLSGLFPLSTQDAPEGCDYAKTLEERYSKPRRCC